MSIRDGGSEIARFGHKNIEKTKAYGMSEDVLRWYAINADNYIEVHTHRLVGHNLVDAGKYLSTKGRNTGFMA
jgi:hypothetical protein